MIASDIPTINALLGKLHDQKQNPESSSDAECGERVNPDDDDPKEYKEMEERWGKEESRRKHEHRVLSDQLFDRLAELNIAKVFISFDGHGDDGQIDEVKVSIVRKLRLTQIVPELREIPFGDGTVYNAVEMVIYGHLSIEHGGWELESGSIGKVVLDVKERKVRDYFTMHLSYEDDDDYNDYIPDDDEDEEEDGNDDGVNTVSV